MATYLELRDVFSDSDLIRKLETAVVIAAHGLSAGTPTTAEKAWIASVLANPKTVAAQATLFVLAANSGATVAQILGATDAAIQTNVDAVVPILVDASAGV